VNVKLKMESYIKVKSKLRTKLWRHNKLTAGGTLTESSICYRTERCESEGKQNHQQLGCTVPVTVLRAGLHEASTAKTSEQELAAS
jgi:hypothetical protein